MPTCKDCPAPAMLDDCRCYYHNVQMAYDQLEREGICRRCVVCQAPIHYTEARVLRMAINHEAKNPSRVTPLLCWVCERLHLSAGDAIHMTGVC